MSSSRKDRVSSHEVDSEENASSIEEAPKPRKTKKKTKARRSKQQQSSGGPLDSLPLAGDSGVGGAVGGVTNTLGGLTGGGQQQQQGDDGGGGKSDTLRLRLDLNLEIEIQLKARIHGDLELALLYVNPLLSPPLPFSSHYSRSSTG